MRIGIATCRHPVAHDDDIDFLLPALRRRGAEAEAVIWNDPKVAWADFDVVLVSSTWDYDEHLREFRAWARKTGKLTNLQNPAATIHWNLDKRYLRELESAGVPIIPTIWTEPGTEDEIEATVAELGWSDIVLKPVVDLGARRLARVETEMVARLLRVIAAPAMAQPFLPALQTEGELSLVFIGGELTHAVRKLPARGDFRVQSQYGGSAERMRAAARGGRAGRGGDRGRARRPALRPRRHDPRRARRPADHRARADRAEPLPRARPWRPPRRSPAPRWPSPESGLRSRLGTAVPRTRVESGAGRSTAGAGPTMGLVLGVSGGQHVPLETRMTGTPISTSSTAVWSRSRERRPAPGPLQLLIAAILLAALPRRQRARRWAQR